jgi:chlorite dismutase
LAVAEDSGQQYVAYTLFRVDPAWRRLPIDEREAGKEAFAELVEGGAERMELRAYSLVGVRPEADFMLWKLTDRFEDFRELQTELNGTPLAGYLETPYSYLGATRPSKYFEEKRKHRRIVPRGAPYLVVYPFVKKREWYALPVEDRGQAMREHAEIGSRFVTITNHTTYSFGIDDQEFMTAFECEEPADFLELMLTLRETEASRYTERDTPIFVGEAAPIRSILASLDGAGARIEA